MQHRKCISKAVQISYKSKYVEHFIQKRMNFNCTFAIGLLWLVFSQHPGYVPLLRLQCTFYLLLFPLTIGLLKCAPLVFYLGNYFYLKNFTLALLAAILKLKIAWGLYLYTYIILYNMTPLMIIGAQILRTLLLS